LKYFRITCLLLFIAVALLYGATPVTIATPARALAAPTLKTPTPSRSQTVPATKTSTPVRKQIASATPTITPVIYQAPALPASEVVYGPSALDFDVAAYLKQAGGYLGQYTEYLANPGWTSAAEIVERVALSNSINPRLLLALLDYQCGCVRGPAPANLNRSYLLGVEDYRRTGLYGQLWWAANQLSAGFYGWQEGWLKETLLPDGTVMRPADDSSFGGVALQVYFTRLWAEQDQSARVGPRAWARLHPDAFSKPEWEQALDPQDGFLAFYQEMFGDYQERARQVEPLVPEGLKQPVLILPFEPGRLWSFTSGPHKAWEKEGSWAALDFAPASDKTGCLPTKAWVVAVGDGPAVRVGSGLVVQDLDGAQPADGIDQTGWAILYMHIATEDRVAPGMYLRAGDRIGHPSCEGGPATGTHLHIARKYNGMWIAAGGVLPFVLDGWTVQAGQKPFEGKLIKDGQVVEAHPYASYVTHIRRPEPTATVKP
jgi:LasA protease